MKLSDCGGHFVGRNANYDGAGSPARRGIGVMFFCPLCVRSGRPWKDCHSLIVHFNVGLDGLPVPEETRRWTEKDASGADVEKSFTLPRWDRTGEAIEDLTLVPSINAEGQDHSGHRGWHGHVTGGEIVGGGI